MADDPFSLVSETDAVALLADCVRTDTVNPAGNEARLAQVLDKWLAAEGIQGQTIPLGENRANYLARLGEPQQGRVLVFSGHMDTVPPGRGTWRYDPWSAHIDGDRMYGRGTCDMKSGLAAMVIAMIAHRRADTAFSGSILLAASAGEEVDCFGARSFVEAGQLQQANAIVIGEPTGGQVFTAHKGALWLRVTTHGRSAHGAFPEKGQNAVVQAIRIARQLEGMTFRQAPHELLGPPTMSLNTIEGGTAVNVVPDRCILGVDIRTLPGQRHDEIRQQIESAARSIDPQADVEAIVDRPPAMTAPDHPLARTSLKVAAAVHGADAGPGGAAYFTDGSIYQAALDVPIILYGPGEATMAHQLDEWVSLSAYRDAVRFFYQLPKAYFSD